jgi:GxxExxY protein
MKPLENCPLTASQLNELSSRIIDAAMQVHRTLGPGLLESAYEACLAYELKERGMKALTQVAMPVTYGPVQIDVGYRVDVIVEDAIILELKTVSEFHPIHEAQLLSYLKLSGSKLGLLINFKVPRLKDGLKRLVNGI